MSLTVLGHPRAAARRPPPPQASPAPWSPVWFRLAGLRPLLHSAVGQQRLVLRGQVWQTLVGADGRRSLRLNAAAWSAVARCDGQHTVQQLWQITTTEHGDQAPTQDELLHMLAQLHAAAMLSFDRTPDFGDAGPNGGTAHHEDTAAQRYGGHRQHLLAWRISLGNPDALLAWLVECTSAPLRLAPARAGFSAWLLLMLWAAGTALLQAGELLQALGPLLTTPSHWGWAWLAYPLMKLLHELAHGLVARRCGAVVADWGITWLMFVPVPYVDASAASALPLRRQRLAVSAAGIVVELTLAAVACVWALNVQPGASRDAALLVVCLALGSSLLVNANPLLRFDGYHMLCDAFSLPNLASRSSQHWLHQMRRHLVSNAPGSAVTAAPGEAKWLWAYAPAALFMRWLVAAAVVLWLGGWSPLLGQLALTGFAWALVLAPLSKLLRWLQRGGWQQTLHDSTNRLPQARTLTTGSARLWKLAAPAAALAAVLLWPLPMSSVAQGVLWLPEPALVRAQASGFVAEVLVADGQTVQAGTPLLSLRAPALQAELERQQGQVQDLMSEYERALRSDTTAAAAAHHALQAAQAALAQTLQRQQRLTVRAQAAGRLVINHAADLPGRHIERGALLAYVVTGEPGIVRLAVAQDDAARLPVEPTTVQLLAADGSGGTRSGRWLGATSGAHVQLPSAALGSRSGGRIAVDSADTAGLRPVQPVVLGDVQLQGPPAQHIGQRVLVRFDHGQAPWLQQAARAGQQVLLRHFNPAS